GGGPVRPGGRRAGHAVGLGAPGRGARRGAGRPDPQPVGSGRHPRGARGARHRLAVAAPRRRRRPPPALNRFRRYLARRVVLPGIAPAQELAPLQWVGGTSASAAERRPAGGNQCSAVTGTVGSAAVSSARDARSDIPATVHAVVISSTAAPTMWIPTNSSGSPVKYWTYPIAPCARVTPSSTSAR